MSKVIGISGVAGSGKDTFLELLSKQLPNVKRFALADNLKRELNPFFEKNYGIDIFTCSREMKNILRPILVAHGAIRRMNSWGRHWTELLELEIQEYARINPDHTIVITDIRYDKYDRDEVYWLKNEMKGTLVHITRYIRDEETPSTMGLYDKRIYVEPANEDEKVNDPKLIKAANYKVEWPTLKNDDGSIDKDSLTIYVKEFVKYLYR